MQKYLWYINLYKYITENKKTPLLINFNEFKAWKYGPVIPFIWKEYNSYNKQEYIKLLQKNNIKPVLDENIKKIIKKVIDILKFYPDNYLSMNTHIELKKIYQKYNYKEYQNISIKETDIDENEIKLILKIK